MRSMERATPDSTPRIKFDNDEVNNLQGTEEDSERVDPKNGVGGSTTIHQQVPPLKLASSFMVEIFIME